MSTQFLQDDNKNNAERMKLLLFGTGDYYRKYIKWFDPENIVALVDNDRSKTGTIIDGHVVVTPDKAVKLQFDRIVVLSVHEKEIRSQLINLGVPDGRIIACAQLFRHPELIKKKLPVCFFSSEREFDTSIDLFNKADAIIAMSYDLNLNGASLALYNAVLCLKESGYSVLVAAWEDGPLRERYAQNRIPVIVDPNLELRTAKEICWLHGFRMVICNSLMYYYFLYDRDMDVKYLWWLHDPGIFYENLDKEILENIPKDNLYVYAAGKIAGDAVEKYVYGVKARQLLYGIQDVPVHRRKRNKILEFAVIANVQRYKGQDILIEALKELSTKELSKIHISIIGNQNSAFALDLKERSVSLAGTVSFIPPVSREKVNKIFDSLDVLIVPSRVDTMSLTAGEAMQHHVVSIVSDAAGISDYITNEIDSLVFRSEDPTALAEKIRWCILHQDQLAEMGDRAREIYNRCFTMDIFHKNLISVVKEVFSE